MIKTKIALFVDVENLVVWIKSNGPNLLLADLGAIGQVIVRRAYGKWTNPSLSPFQEELNRQGFELIHNYHPVSGKNSSDIQMTVDIMEYALKLADVEWFVLATGDSDFSPLFRKLREMGKDVIGVGPKSPLSESVKTSCSRYIYTDQINETSREIIALERDDAEELLEKVISQYDGPILLSPLKASILQIDSAFNEKYLGYKSFTDFLESVDFIELIKDQTTGQTKALYKSAPQEYVKDKITLSQTIKDIDEYYRKILRKKQWHIIPISIVDKIYRESIKLQPMTRPQLREKLLEVKIDGITSALVSKVLTIFFKSRLFEEIHSSNESDEKEWQILNIPNYQKEIDSALLIRLLVSLSENKQQINHVAAMKICYGKYNLSEFKIMLDQANNSIQQQKK